MPVGYHGVLKAGAPSTRKAAEPTVVVTLGRAKKSAPSTTPMTSAQDRLGIQKPEVSTTTSHMDSVTVKPSLQMRLGGQSTPMNKTFISGLQGQNTTPGIKKNSALLKRLGTPVTPKENNSRMQQRLGGLVKPNSPALQARLGEQKRVTITAPKVTTTTSSPGNIVITRRSTQAAAGIDTGKVAPKKTSLADRLGAKVKMASGKSSAALSTSPSASSSAGIFSRASRTSSMASDRTESGVMKRLGMPMSGGSQSEITSQSRWGLQKSKASPTKSTVRVSKPDLRVRLGVQKAEASSTTPSLGITVTTSGSGHKIVQSVGKKRKLSMGTNVGLDATPKMRRVATNSGVFGRLGATM